MASLNKVLLIGNLGRDPEIRMTPGGQKVASFSIATTERYNDRNGQRQERTDWHNIVAWAKLADIIERFAKKGTMLYIEGRIQTRSYDDAATGQKKYRTDIVANQVQLLTPRAAGERSGESSYGGNSYGNGSGNGGGGYGNYSNSSASHPDDSGAPPMGADDDLPF